MATATDVRVTFPLKDLRAAFGIAAKVAPLKSPKTILTSIRLDLEPGFATFSATDLEMGIRHRIASGFSDDPVSVVLPRQITDAILRVAESEELTFAFSGPSLEVTCPSAEWTIQTEDADGFPAVPEFDAKTWHSVEAERLALMIRRTAYAIDPLSNRYALGGTCCEPLLTALAFTGTDGRVIAHQQIEASVSNGLPSLSTNPVIPAKALKFLQSIIPDSLDLVDIGFPDANRVYFRCGETTLFSRLVEGRFPGWKHVVPTTKLVGQLAINAGSLKRAVARATTHLSSETRRMTLAFTDDVLALSCRSSLGEASASLPVSWDANDAEFDVTPKHLVDMVNGLGDEVSPTFEFRDDGKPIVVRLEDTFVGVISTLEPEKK